MVLLEGGDGDAVKTGNPQMLGIQGLGATAGQMPWRAHLPSPDRWVPVARERGLTDTVLRGGSCSPQRRMSAGRKECSSFRHGKSGRQSAPGLRRSRPHYSLKWINWPLEVRLPLVLKDASLYHIIACPSLCC